MKLFHGHFPLVDLHPSPVIPSLPFLILHFDRLQKPTSSRLPSPPFQLSQTQHSQWQVVQSLAPVAPVETPFEMDSSLVLSCGLSSSSLLFSSCGVSPTVCSVSMISSCDDCSSADIGSFLSRRCLEQAFPKHSERHQAAIYRSSGRLL